MMLVQLLICRFDLGNQYENGSIKLYYITEIPNYIGYIFNRRISESLLLLNGITSIYSNVEQ